jgi:hypothetical protein
MIQGAAKAISAGIDASSKTFTEQRKESAAKAAEKKAEYLRSEQIKTNELLAKRTAEKERVSANEQERHEKEIAAKEKLIEAKLVAGPLIQSVKNAQQELEQSQKKIFPKAFYITKEQHEFENKLYDKYASPDALVEIKINTIKSVKSVINSINAALPYKLIFLIAFFAIFYNVIFNICIFFGIDIILLNMYMGWVSFLLILFTFLPTDYSNIFTPNKE